MSQLESILIPSSVRTHGLKVKAWIQHSSCVLHALRRHQVTRSDAERWYKLNVCIVFYTHWGDMNVAKARPGDGLNSSFVHCFTCVEATSGYRKWCRGMLDINPKFVVSFTGIEVTSEYHKWCQRMLSTQLLYCVLQALRRHQGTISDAWGWYKLLRHGLMQSG